MRVVLLACCAMLMMVAGCGYTTGSMLPANYRNISVDNFKNSVTFVSDNSRALYVPLLETKVRAAIIDRYQFDGHLRVSNADKADLLLKGELVAFERDELRITDNQDVQEYRVRVIMSLTLSEASGEVI